MDKKRLPKEYSVVREAAQKLHEALTDAWGCTGPSHSTHTAKLFLEAEVEKSVQLGLVMCCSGPLLTKETVYVQNILPLRSD